MATAEQVSNLSLTKRQLLKAAIGTGLTLLTPNLLGACSPTRQETPTPPRPTVGPKPPRPEDQLTRVHEEVKRLALAYPADSLVRTVFLGDVAKVSPVFVSPLPVGFMDNSTYARTHFAEATYSLDKRFRYTLTRDGLPVGYATLQQQVVRIYFSGIWLDSKSDQVKSVALEAEALKLGLWDPFSRLTLNTYLSQGKVEKIDPTVTDPEIARTFARNLLIDDADVRKLYDYSAYLAVLNRVGQLVALKDPQITTELDYPSLLKIYNLAKSKNIPFEGLNVNSTDFLRMAFDPNGAWAKMILDPAIPTAPAPGNSQ